MSQHVISEAEPLGKAMGFRVSAEGPDGLDGKAMGFLVSPEGPRHSLNLARTCG